MADNLDGRTDHGTSDFYHDPYCDSCDEDGRNVKAFSFCPVCGTFLCQSCHNVHSRLPATKSHGVLREDSMPASQADKPVKYPLCSKNTGQSNDRYCKTHRQMLCEKCQKESHVSCEVQSISDVCKTFDASKINELVDFIREAQEYGKAFTVSMQENEERIVESKSNMLTEIKELYDKAVSVVDRHFISMEQDIQHVCSSQTQILSEQRTKVSEITEQLNRFSNDLKKVNDKAMDVRNFIKYQELLESVNDKIKDLDEIAPDSEEMECYFIVSEELQTFLTACSAFGKVNVKSHTLHGSQRSLSSLLNDIVQSKREPADRIKDCQPSADPYEAFSHEKKIPSDKAGTTQSNLYMVAIVKQDTLNVNIKEDTQVCHITGIALAENGDIFVIDWNNDKIKLFSPNGKLISFLEISSLKLAYWPCDICVFNRKTVIVCVTGTSRLHILSVSKGSISMKRNINFKDIVWAVAKYGSNLAVVCGSSARAIKVVNLNGELLWSVTNDAEGQTIFEKIHYISDFGQYSRRIAVTDAVSESITLLNADSGKILKSSTMKGKAPKQIVGNPKGHIYVSCSNTREITLWSEDLTESFCLVPKCRNELLAMANDSGKNELFVSYESSDIIDRFILS